ncbi:MAG: hypothetical protein ABIV06_13195 [Thermoanaerobaculia bacterium]
MPRTSAPIALLVSLLGWAGCSSTVPPAPTTASGERPPAVAPLATAPTAATTSPSEAPPKAPEAPYRNTVRWATASEVDSFGFDVFRAESEEGPFERLNSRTISGAGTSDESHTYSYVDETIDPAKEYFYYVEGIDLDGTRERITPVNRARAKLPPPAAPAP